MASLEQIQDMKLVDSCTDNFWNLTDEQKETVFMRPTFAALADKIFKKAGEWWIHVSCTMQDDFERPATKLELEKNFQKFYYKK